MMETAAIGVPADPAPYRVLKRAPGARIIEVIYQRALPHANVTVRIAAADAAALAIRKMMVRRAPLTGLVGPSRRALALARYPRDAAIATAHAALDATRPTAVKPR